MTTINDLQNYLAKFPQDMEVKILPDHSLMAKAPIYNFDIDDHILETSDTAFVDTAAPEDEWDCEDGKVELGDGRRFLLINPIII